MFGGQGGGNPPSYPFQQPPSTTAASEQAPSPAASAGGLFDQVTSASGGFGQPSGLFGHSASTFGWGAGSGATSTTGSSLFQQQTPSPALTTNVPGNTAAFAQSSSGSSLFGRPASSFGQPPSTAAPTFGALSATGSGMSSGPNSAGFQPSTLPVFGSAASAPSALFGKPPTQLNQAEAQPSAPTAVVTAGATAGSTFTDKAGSTIRSLFGKTSDSAAAGAALFGKKTDSGAAGGVSLFGKTDSGAAAGAPLFGKTTDSAAAAGAALFGKNSDSAGAGAGAAAGAALFGKTSDSGTTAAGAGLFGKKPGTDTAGAGGAALFRKTSSGAGLFGKAADFAEDDSGADDIEEFGAPPRSAAGPRPRASRGGAGPAAGRLKSVFAQPTGTAPAGPRRAISPAEAARRSLARAGLFGKPPESRQMVDKSPVTGPSPAGPRVQRLSSVEELQQVTSLLCTEVPEGYNDKAILTRHFGKFGKVIKVTCSKAKNSASVHFADHASADAAKKRGARVHPKLPAMNLFFRRPVKSAPPPPQAPTSSSADDASDDQRPAPGAGEAREPRRLPPVATAAAPPAAPAAPPAAALNVSELRAALRQAAASASERFRVLDARDKLHRAALRREGPARSGPLVGTCADMCPEKERYMREEKHQISGQYERDRDRQGGFEMDHRLAVKQYSRSSADQEEPLPHELRTPAALLRTMDYLVTHVTDSESRDTGDWFHFIWDRTRGIRKDITQQQLTDVVSVGLVEKCARFHVHCAASLCELSRDMFDQKINNENLTKCLQTLKHMYHDLSLKGVRCEREAEFRAYDILLNLNQGDILREAQTYSDEVRDSPEVQSALRLYGALSTNNYVRFFTLVRRADYLSSCLLQRYFNQVRTRALDVITRAFCPAKQVVEFPLSQLQRMLGFESEQECASVLRQHGLESEEGTAFLERAQFLPPDTPPELRRCPTLIDAKLGGWTVGQAVQGGPLPADPLPEYRPHDSFDAHGVLRRSAWDVQDQTTGGEGVGTTTAAALALPPPATERAVSPARETAELLAHRVAMSAAGQILTEVVTEETRRQSEQLLAAAAAARHICARIHQDTMDQVVTEMVRSVCQTELAEARRLAQEQRRFQEQQRRQAEERRARELQMQERARQDQIMKDRLASVLTETLVAEVCLDETADIAEQEMQTVQAQHSVLAEVHARLWTEGADQLARQTAEHVLAECRRQRETLVRALQEIGRRMTLRRLVGRWRRVAEDGRRLRADQWLFPAGLPLHDAATTLQLLGGPRAPHHPPADPWADGSLCSLLLHDRLSTQPVSVPAVLSRAVASAAVAGGGGAASSGGRRLWKLAVPAPAGCPLTQWLLHKLTDPDPPQRLPDGVLQLGTAPLPSGGGRLSVCVRRLEGRPAESVGSAGLLLAFSGSAAAADRLNQLLSELPREPLVPLAVLAADDAQQSALAQLRLPERLRAGAVTTYRLFELHPEDGVQSGRALVSALEWLYAHTPPPPPLRAARLRHLAQDFLWRQVTRRLYSDMQTRRSRRRVEQSPVAGLALYNAAVRHLSVVLSSGSLPDLSWPPAELMESSTESESESGSALPPPGWNRPERLLKLQQAVCDLSLPPLDVDPDWSWSECCAKVLQYVTRLSGGDGDGAPALYRVRSLLRDRLQLLRRAAWPLNDDVGDQPLSASLPWTDIVQSCIELRVERISCANEQAFFLPDELDNFRVPDVWIEYTSVGHTEESLTLDESVTLAKRSLDTSAAEETTSPAGKRRPDRSSLGRPTLDVSADISREMNVSLDWEQRLRELVDQGDASGAAAPLPPPPARTTPPRAGRRASLEHQLQLLRAQLADDRRSAQRLERQLQLAAAAGLSPPPLAQGGPRG